MMTQRPVAFCPNEFSPLGSNAKELGFLENGRRARFAEACSALNVRQTSEPQTGYGQRSYGAKVTDDSGASYWLKVFGLRSVDNERWKAEIAADAITGLPKPELFRQTTWKHIDEFWVARLTTLAADVIEVGPWAGANAAGMPDPWLERLVQSLQVLTRQPCTRTHVRIDLFERWLWRHFKRRMSITPSDWVPSHNDLQWSNLSHPDLSILDWEWFGRSPPGYDQGSLIAYSCHDDSLTARLEKAFGATFDSELATFGRLFAAHTIRNSVDSGWLNPAMREPVGRLIERWDSHIRKRTST